jgi:hypothetical protein
VCFDELQAFVKAEVIRWGKVVQEAGVAGSELGSSAAPARPIAGTVTRTERAPFQAAILIEASGLLLVLGLLAPAARNHRHF